MQNNGRLNCATNTASPVQCSNIASVQLSSQIKARDFHHTLLPILRDKPRRPSASEPPKMMASTAFTSCLALFIGRPSLAQTSLKRRVYSDSVKASEATDDFPTRRMVEPVYAANADVVLRN